QWSDRPSRKLYYMLYENGELIGIFGLGSAFHQPKVVSTFMNKYDIKFNELANNIVYAIKPGSNKNIASSFLKLCREQSILDWKERYGDQLKAFQTFVLPPRNGTLYKADNWHLIGQTAGTKSLVTK